MPSLVSMYISWIPQQRLMEYSVHIPPQNGTPHRRRLVLFGKPEPIADSMAELVKSRQYVNLGFDGHGRVSYA